MRGREHMKRANTAVALGLHTGYRETGVQLHGTVFFDMRDARSGESLVEWQKDNIITLDAGILVARLCKDNAEPAHGINMLAVGTGALGAVLNPDTPSNQQRSLNQEIARKAFENTTFRDAQGAASSIATNVVDFTTVFNESEAVGPLNEMALLSTLSANAAITNPNPNTSGQGGQPYDPTIDVSQYDSEVNHLTFGAVVKPATAILSITWRISF